MSKFIQWPLAAAAAAAILLGGCTSTGMGGGDIVQQGKPAVPVLFSWKSSDGGITGSMTATLPAATYQGRFLQVTRQTQSDALAPMWGDFPTGWSDWSYWGMGGMGGTYDPVQFATIYSGKVIATLKSVTGSQMRCRLHMLKPDQGMSGGGAGECQILGGATIQASF